MRTAFAILLLLATVSLVSAQPMKDPEPRYGVQARVKLYPQNTPKAALKTALELIEKGELAYFVGQMLDPKFVDDQVSDRVKAFELVVERELTQLRDFQRANPDKVDPKDRLSQDPKEFQVIVTQKARERAFKFLLKEIEDKLKEDPQAFKDMRKIYLSGTFADGDPTASASHPEVKGRTLYFKKIGDRWFIENKQADEPKKDP